METAHGSLAAQCANCDAVLTGEFCSRCGQASAAGHANTVPHFLHDLLHESLHIDGKIFRTLKALFLEPGRLTKEYWDGKIIAWVSPIRLFIVAAAVHLLLSTGTGPLNLQFKAHRRITDGRISLTAGNTPGRPVNPNQRDLPAEDAARLKEKFGHIYLAIRYASPLLFAGFCWLIYRRRQRYFVAHLIAGLHFYAFWYLLAVVAGTLARWYPYAGFLAFGSFFYLLLTLRRLYRQSWLWSIISTAALFVMLIVIEALLAGVALSFAIAGANSTRS